MTGTSEKVGRCRSKKARAALAEARQRAKESPAARETVEVFVTRVSSGSYGWEIRQFGGVVLEKGQGFFTTSAEAQADGARALTVRFSATPDETSP